MKEKMTRLNNFFERKARMRKKSDLLSQMIISLQVNST
jgi:hypothetical protein